MEGAVRFMAAALAAAAAQRNYSRRERDQMTARSRAPS